MTFYKNNLVAIEKKDIGIYLARKIKHDIIVDFVKKDTNIFKKQYVISNIIGEFDVDIDENNEMIFTYVNSKNNLVLNRIQDRGDNEIRILENISGDLVDLKIISFLNNQNIFYMIRSASKDLLEIFHVNIINNEVKRYKVDQVKIYNIINPLRIVEDNDNLIIAYYYRNQICIKEFDKLLGTWSPSITLTDNQNRLYLDILKDGDYLHLVYANHFNDNFIIKYNRFLVNKDYILLEEDTRISNSGNNTDPILLKVYDILWVVWKSTNQLYSSYSTDNGKSWSDIYMWNDTKYLDIVKYKYVTDIFDSKVKLNHAYGSVNKDIKFLGFGDIDGIESMKRSD